MSNAPTDTKFLVEEVGVLHQGKLALAGVVHGQSVEPGMCAVVSFGAGQIAVEVLSVGIVDPPPGNPNKKLLQVRVSGGDARSLKSLTLHFK